MAKTSRKPATSDDEPELVVRSPRPLPQPAEGEPAMTMDRLRAFRDNPADPDATKYAAELLQRCGALVLDGLQYELTKAGRITATPVELLATKRARTAEGIEKEPQFTEG